MTEPIKTVNTTENPSRLKNAFYTVSPIIAGGFEVGKALAEGKTTKEALAQTKETFSDVREGNVKQFKKDIHNIAEYTRGMGAWKYVFGLVPIGIEALDKAIN